MNKRPKTERCDVVAEPMPQWFRAWYTPRKGTLQLTRSGMATRQCVIRAAEAQFGKSWRELSTKGQDGTTTVIRAVRGVITLSPKDTKFRSAQRQASVSDAVLRPHWPEGLEQGRFYQFNCDDDGRDGQAFFRVLVANDSDVHLCASKLIEPGFTDEVSGKWVPSIYASLPSIRCRTGIGGGRHARTRQALLWLAKAIQLDNEELGITDN